MDGPVPDGRVESRDRSADPEARPAILRVSVIVITRFGIVITCFGIVITTAAR
jgi:hypothetical protein